MNFLSMTIFPVFILSLPVAPENENVSGDGALRAEAVASDEQTKSDVQTVSPEEQAVIHIPVQRKAAKATHAVNENTENKVLRNVPGLEKVPEIIDGLRLTLAERSIIAITNSERAKRGLRPLIPSRKLMESSRRHAAWMAATGVFRHGASAAAENIARGQRSSSAAMNAWMNSSGHRRNLLGSGHAQIGVGAYRSPNGQMYWCQQFTR